MIRNGVLESARRYSDEVSDGDLDLVNAGVVGPVRLAKAWASYATADATGQTNGWRAVRPAAHRRIRAQNEAAGGRRSTAGGRPDDRRLDRARAALPARPRGMNPGPLRVAQRHPARAATSSASRSRRDTPTIPFPWGSFDITVPIIRTIQMFSMPDDWETRDEQRRVRGETVAHEMGHNFGLPDEYARTGHPSVPRTATWRASSRRPTWSSCRGRSSSPSRCWSRR